MKITQSAKQTVEQLKLLMGPLQAKALSIVAQDSTRSRAVARNQSSTAVADTTTTTAAVKGKEVAVVKDKVRQDADSKKGSPEWQFTTPHLSVLHHAGCRCGKCVSV